MRAQDNFVSATAKAEEAANAARISEQKSRTALANPLEPLIVSLLKSFTDDADLVAKLESLYKARALHRALHRTLHRTPAESLIARHHEGADARRSLRGTPPV